MRDRIAGIHVRPARGTCERGWLRGAARQLGPNGRQPALNGASGVQFKRVSEARAQARSRGQGRGPIVYLDVGCFKHPFDDASLERVRREAEAVAAILDATRAGAFQRVRSPAHDFENERNPREDRRLATRLWLNAATSTTKASAPARARARELAELGFEPLDALHLGFAEQSSARWFVTTDDHLLQRASAARDRLKVDVLRPDQIPFEVAGRDE